MIHILLCSLKIGHSLRSNLILFIMTAPSQLIVRRFLPYLHRNKMRGIYTSTFPHLPAQLFFLVHLQGMVFTDYSPICFLQCNFKFLI